LAKAGKLRILGVGARARVAAAREIPTIAEQGLPGYEAGTWYGVFTRAGVPQPTIERLAQEVRRAVEDPKSRQAIAAQGVDPRASTPGEFRELFRAEYERWGKVIREARIKAD
jgi:tripartite-type tricarboxylate transporter receptor subunit TctC